MSWRMQALMTLFTRPRDAISIGRRWRAAARDVPGLEGDLIELAGLRLMQPHQRIDGAPEPEAIGPEMLAYHQGKRDLALQLLALMGLTQTEFNSLFTEEKHDEDHR